METNQLMELTVQIRQMMVELRKSIQGQENAIDSFAQGVFAAELLSQSDDKRKQPQAIFVFAGPPGVGKTLLSERAADILGLPFKRFDMSSYADYQAHMGLIGYDRSYQAAKRGTLTGFVNENPHCILLFDEIEKAHINTIQLFLQILDAGRLRDRYLNKVISFRETIIIFTTNAGKTLYGNNEISQESITRKMILETLEREINPQTGSPYFPPSITSRLATGWPLLFQTLEREDLINIIRAELERLAELFEKQYGIKVEIGKELPVFLYQQESVRDARILRAQTELYFKNQIFRLWNDILNGKTSGKIESITIWE